MTNAAAAAFVIAASAITAAHAEMTPEELAKLADMLAKGLLTREEFDLMKAKIIGLPTI